MDLLLGAVVTVAAITAVMLWALSPILFRTNRR